MSDVLAEFYQETSEAESNEERGRYVVPVAFKLAGELSAYRAAWAKVKEYLIGPHFKSDYPNVMLDNTAVSSLMMSLLEDFGKDYGIGANPTKNGHPATPPAPPEARPLTISDDLPDLLFRRCGMSQDGTMKLAEEIRAMVKAPPDAAEPVTKVCGYWRDGSRDESKRWPERFFSLENAYNHATNAYFAAEARTKAIEAERDALKAEVERLRRELGEASERHRKHCEAMAERERLENRL